MATPRVYIAKIPASLSNNPKLQGRSEDLCITVREIVISTSAGFWVPLIGETLRMPGLPKYPQTAAEEAEKARLATAAQEPTVETAQH